MKTEMKDWFVDIDEKDYHAGAICSGGEFMSSHNLATFRDNPRTFSLLALGRIPRPESPALAFGRAVHCHALEPSEEWTRRFLVSDGPVNEKTGAPYGRSTQKYAQFLASTAKEVVSTKDYETILGISESVWSHKEAHELLAKGSAERTIRVDDMDCGVPAQARIDWFSPDYGIVDLKTTGDDLKWFDRAAHDFGYAYQMAFYRRLLELKSGTKFPVYIIAVEKKAPYTVGVFKYAEDVLAQAEAANDAALREYAECDASGVFPTRFEETRLLTRI